MAQLGQQHHGTPPLANTLKVVQKKNASNWFTNQQKFSLSWLNGLGIQIVQRKPSVLRVGTDVEKYVIAPATLSCIHTQMLESKCDCV
jgi:hypothetical protein